MARLGTLRSCHRMRMFYHVVLDASFGEVLHESNCDAHGQPPTQPNLKISEPSMRRMRLKIE